MMKKYRIRSLPHGVKLEGCTFVRANVPNSYVFVKTKQGQIFVLTRGCAELDLTAPYRSSDKDRRAYARLAITRQQTIESLRQQLTECQKECEERARLLGKGSEREAALMARLEERERERKSALFQIDSLINTAKVNREGLQEQLATVTAERDELIAQKFSEEPLRRQIAELRELGRFREKHFLTGSPEVYDDPSAAFHKFACEMHDALKVGADKTGEV